MNETTFIDWIDCRQQYPRAHPEADYLPVVAGYVHAKGTAIDCEGEIDGKRHLLLVQDDKCSYRYSAHHHEGSHDTKLHVLSDGLNVKVSGNVGRLDRQDNIWNYGLAETMVKASNVVAEYGLPAFSTGEKVERDSISEHDFKRGVNPWVWTGCHFQELHVTRNYYTGSEALSRECLRHFQTRRASRVGKGTYGNQTVYFGNRGGKLHKLIVCYHKADEMLAHARGEEAKARVKASQAYQFARDMGLVRVECKWGRDFLREHNLRYLGDLCPISPDGTQGEADMARIISLFNRETDFLHDAAPDRTLRIVADLPAKLRSSALHWIEGKDVRDLCGSLRTFQRHRKALLDYGIDITEPRRVDGRPNSEDALQRMIDNLPRFELRELPPPEWYGLPDVERRAA